MDSSGCASSIPQGTYDFNHVYLDSETRAAALPRAQHAIDAPAEAGTRAAQATRRVGLIDGGVDAAHEDFTGIRFQHSAAAANVIPSAPWHLRWRTFS